MNKIQLIPDPAKVEWGGGAFRRPDRLTADIAPEIVAQCAARGYDPQREIAGLLPAGEGGRAISLEISRAELPAEGYTLRILPDRIQIDCADGAGAHYALLTLGQILTQCNDSIPCGCISDAPVLAIRGVLLDVGRDKVPTMETLFALIDQLALLRLNHLELYMEGYTYQWPQYEYLFTDETPLTGEELRSLTEFAAQRCIELVPNMNILGHMEKWLDKPQFRAMAECEDGYLFQNLYHREPMTIDVRDDRALAFTMEMLDQLAENFQTPWVNVNMDEPFELGVGKNAEFAATQGKAKLYTDYLLKVHKILTAKGKRMILWGDVIFAHPECIPQLPDDILLLDWIYEGDADFEADCKAIAATGRDFCLCPGSSSWASFTGRIDNMRRNVDNAVDCAVRYGAKGVVLTDWGDLGHWQYLSASYPAFAYAGLSAWGGKQPDEALVADFCNRYLYGGLSGDAYQLAKDMGNYYLLEHAPLYSTTLCFAVLCSKYRFHTVEEFGEKMELMLLLNRNLGNGLNIPEKERVIGLDGEGLTAYLADLEQRAAALEPTGESGGQIREEMRLSIRMVAHGLQLYRAMTEQDPSGAAFRGEMGALFTDLDDILRRHHGIWGARNRKGGFARSTAQFQHLLRFYRKHSQEVISQ